GVEGTLEQLLRDAILKGVPPDDATLVATHISDGVVIGEWRNPQGNLAQRTPLWGKNTDHVLLSQARLKGTEVKLKEVLEQQGYTRPSLDVNFVPRPDHTIDLHVDVRNPG